MLNILKRIVSSNIKRTRPLISQSSSNHFESKSNDILRFLDNKKEILKSELIDENYDINNLKVQLGITKVTLTELDEICYKDLLIDNGDNLVINQQYYELENVKSTHYLISPLDINNVDINNEFLENYNNIIDLSALSEANKEKFLSNKGYYLIEGCLSNKTITEFITNINEYNYIE
jgi:glycine cleavage system H lipoate-binding protein